MKTYLIKPGIRQAIANAGETDVAVSFDGREWKTAYPSGHPQLLVTTPGGRQTPVTVEDNAGMIEGRVPEELLSAPGAYVYQFVWTQGSTQQAANRCDVIITGSELSTTWETRRHSPEWAEKIFLAAEVIEGAMDGTLEARNAAMDAADDAAASKEAAALSQENAAASALSAAEDAAAVADKLDEVNAAGAAQLAAIQLKGETTLASIPEDYTALDSEVDDMKSALDSGGVFGNVVAPLFVSGNVALTDGALVYSESTTRCVTAEGNAIVVEPGTVVRLTDRVNYRYRCYYNGGTATWYSMNGSWAAEDSVIPSGKQRKLVVMIKKNGDGTITANDTVGLIRIILPNRFPDYNGEFYKNFSIDEQLALPGALPNSYNGVASGSENYRLSHFIPVKQGMVITTNLTSGGGKIIAMYDDELNYVDGAASGSASYTVTSDGFVRFSGDAAGAGFYVCFDSSIPDRINCELNTINGKIEEGLTGTDYMQTAVARITAQLKAKSALGVIPVFGFNTDQHIKDEDDASKTLPVLRGLQALSMLTREYPFDFICLGGDACDSGSYATTVDLILDECVTVQKPLYDAWCPIVPITGNHDAHQNNASITGEQMFNAHFRRIANSGFLSGWDSSHTNGYWDSAAHKIRFVFLDDTARSDYDSTARNSALSAMLAGAPAGYNIVIFSHHPLSSDLQDTKWQNPCSCQSILADYASRIICCICGHSHADVSEVSAGILYIGTTMAQYGTDLDGNTATLGVETETAFDTFVIDQANRHIYAFRYGKGADRDWTYTLT